MSWAGSSTVQSWHASQLDARRGVVLDVGDTPQPVRRALIFIDAHAGDPITLNEIALDARLSRRGLQAASVAIWIRRRGLSTWRPDGTCTS
jgi:transcriptional regulator GlxA family with amidase domain